LPAVCAQGLDVTSLREIKVLRELKSPYVVSVLDIVPHKKKFTMVGIVLLHIAHCCCEHAAAARLQCASCSMPSVESIAQWIVQEHSMPVPLHAADQFQHQALVHGRCSPLPPPAPSPCQVLEFLDSDLEALIKAKGVVLSPGDVKAYMLMLLKALQDCHQHWVLHRDIKPNNMLISRDGEDQHNQEVAQPPRT
jgi:serine/threonine protein kinase